MTEIAIIVGFADAEAPVEMLPRVRYTKNGGMRFLRIGRLQMSWCICKRSI